MICGSQFRGGVLAVEFLHALKHKKEGFPFSGNPSSSFLLILSENESAGAYAQELVRTLRISLCVVDE